jgi:hypothetical protein
VARERAGHHLQAYKRFMRSAEHNKVYLKHFTFAKTF